MYKGLDEEEAFMLRELTLMGFPPITWFMEAEGRIDDGSTTDLFRSLPPR